MSMRHRLLLAVVLILLPGVATAQVDDLEAAVGRRVIHEDELRAAGLSRLSDVFRLLDEWYAVSVEGYAWHASANGLAPIQRPGWVVMLNGHVLDLQTLDTQNIDLLPVNIAEIDSVVVYDTPQLVDGLFAGAGLIHLYARRAREDVSVHGSFGAGNEINDPGPFRFTGVDSPNIDRIGPIYSAGLGFREQNVSLNLGFKADEYHSTDERIRQRVVAAQGDNRPRIIHVGEHASLDVRGTFGGYNVLVSHTRLEDLLYLSALGREMPFIQRVSFGGISGFVGTTGHLRFRYRFGYTLHDLDPRPNTEELDVDWRQDRVRGNVEVGYVRRKAQASAGLAGAFFRNYTARPVRLDSLVQFGAYGTFSARPVRQALVTGGASAIFDGDRLNAGAYVTATAVPLPHNTVTLTGSFQRRTPRGDDSIWFWTANGFNFFDQNSASFTDLPFQPLEGTLTADGAWRYRPAGWLSLRLAGLYRQFYGQYLARFSYGFDEETASLPATTTIVPYVAGTVAGGRASLRLQPHRTFVAKLYYGFTRPSGSDVTFWQAWRNQPWHQASAQVTFAPNAQFTLFVRARYFSSTRWPAYAGSARLTEGSIPEVLPHFVLLDATAQKYFWQHRIRTVVSLRNLLNEAYRTHPAGAVTNMALHVRLEARL